MTEYFIMNSAVTFTDKPSPDKKILKVIHNAGFFSCATIKLLDIIRYFNEYKKLPDEVDSSEQFMHYKSYAGDNLIPFYFNEKDSKIEYNGEVPIRDCMAMQFAPYKYLNIDSLNPFLNKYFLPSNHVFNIAKTYLAKYGIEYENFCSVFYRGNDKNREMKVGSYSLFIEKAKEIKALNPDIRFLVQPDEPGFLEAFLDHFPDAIFFEETPACDNPDSCTVFELPIKERAEFGAKFFAALLVISQCEHMITHSGNCGLWAALYRRNPKNIHQLFNDEWL